MTIGSVSKHQPGTRPPDHHDDKEDGEADDLDDDRRQDQMDWENLRRKDDLLDERCLLDQDR